MNRLQENQLNFINLRLGTFIHFNSATVQFQSGDITDWEFDHENHGAPRRFPFSEKDWNPDSLDCRQWAQAAKSAGCRFAALTTKHHEGFALWPTAYGTHSVKYAEGNVDVVAAYLKAFREEGIAAGQYFPMNINFMLNLSPDASGRLGENLVREFARIGEMVSLPEPLKELPEGWLERGK